MRNSSGVATAPGSQTRLRSLRIRSTIIRFSARSLSLASNSAARRASSAGVAPRGRVPLIGRVSTVKAPPASASMRTKRSGELETRARPSMAQLAAKGAGLPAARRRTRSKGWTPDASRPDQDRAILAWKISPASIRAMTSATADS